jgi:exonuclease SbcC
VLEAYYTLEDTEQRYREVQESETTFGALVEQLETCSSELAGKEKELQNIEPGAKDAEQRSVLEVKLENTELSLKEVQGDYESWTKNLLQSEALEKELPTLQKELEAIEQERVQVQTFARSRELRERFEGLRNKRERWKKLEAELKQLLPVSRSRLNQLRDCATEIERLKASLEAGNLSLVFRTNEAVDLLVHKDMEAPAKQHLRENKSLDIEAAGKIELHHPNWSLEVYSGKGEFDKLAEKYKHAQSRFQKLLKELQVISIEQAQEASERYETRAEEIRAAQTLYEQELGQDSFEALETACGEQIEAHPSRELNQVLEELVEKQAQVRQAESRLEEARKTFEKLKKQYQSRDALFARVAELGGLKQKLTREMAGLAPLPKGYSDARSLIQSYNGLKEEIETLKREKIRLQSDCRNAEATLPDESSEESHCRLEDVKEIFSKRVDKAAVLVRIQQAVAALLEEIDRGLYDPFTTLVSRYLASLSDNRYTEVPSSASLPAAVLRSDGQALPYDLLSAGTRDIFALAVRLAMAEFFLGNAEGFLVLDDPLVDLDPQRRQQAAAVLAEFPHQLLIFTCHPAHADLLGKANRIELERV